MTDENILIVEDSPTQAEQLRHILEQYDYQLRIAANGREALTVMADWKPDLIISDIVMPEMDGYELCRRINGTAHYQDIPVILLTSLSDPNDIIKALECGADNFITKPCDEESLISQIRQCQIDRQQPTGNDSSDSMEVSCGGQSHIIHADRRQILKFLLSTYETAFRKNRKLSQARDELSESNEQLAHALAELQQSEQRYRTLASATFEGIALTEQGRFIDVNERMTQILGCGRDEMIGMEMAAVIPGELPDVMGDVPSAQESHREHNLLRKDGSIRIVEARGQTITQKGRQLRITAIRDITEQRKMQEELLKAQNLESLGVLAGGIAHDFNNVLSGILSNLSFARMQLNPAHSIVKTLDACEKIAKQATDLTQQLLTFAHGGEPVKKVLSAASLIRETVPFVLRGSNVKGEIELADDLWPTEADESQFRHALYNLLINAVQAMPDGGTISVRAVNESMGPGNPYELSPGTYIRIAVQDHGCGISPENLQRIFDPYFTTKPGSTGLGLASVYSIVKRHYGAVEVSSSAGGGSTFTLHLPSSPGRMHDEEENEQVMVSGSGKLLIMDDEEFIRDILNEILLMLGYQVECCADGREAVERFLAARVNGTPFDAVMLDLTVPCGMGGKEAAEKILEIDPQAVLVVSSGYSSDPVIANFSQYGFSAAISKPFTADTLGRELEKLVSGRQRDTMQKAQELMEEHKE
jgi:PAS domain S-box-containing protein